VAGAMRVLASIIRARSRATEAQPLEADLHLGKFRASELIDNIFVFSYHDTTLDETHRELAMVTQAPL
jgi:hypothetical protein